jgi:hypothetical protein
MTQHFDKSVINSSKSVNSPTEWLYLVRSGKVDEPGGRGDASDHGVDVDKDAELALGGFHLISTENKFKINQCVETNPPYIRICPTDIRFAA